MMIPGWLVNIAYGGFGLVGFVLTMLYVFQENILYVPHVPGSTKEYTHSPNQARLNYKDIWLETRDKKKLHGWLMWCHTRKLETLKERPTIVFFQVKATLTILECLFPQANAGNIAHRLPFFHDMVRSLDCGVIAISYRGYGPSEGSPTEWGLKIDAETVLDLCNRCEHVDPNQVFIFGRSLGGAVAIDLASKHQDKLTGLIVENTFTSVVDMVPRVLPLLKPLMRLRPAAHLLIRNKWNNRATIQKITQTPVLFLSSGETTHDSTYGNENDSHP